MKFRKVTAEEFNSLNVKKKKSYTRGLVEEFINSNIPVGELCNWTEHWCSAYSVRSCIQRVITRDALPVRVAVRRERIFLFRTDMEVSDNESK